MNALKLPNNPPALVGERYCSSWCGRGCTRQEYEAAVENGVALAARMGPGWTAEIWENLGWHHRARCGVFEVTGGVDHLGRATSFTAFVQTKPQFVGHHESDPHAALREALEDAAAVVRDISEALHSSGAAAGTIVTPFLTVGEPA